MMNLVKMILANQVMKRYLHKQGRFGASRPNVGRNERVASLAAGSLMALLGFRRRSKASIAAAIAGGLLMNRGMSGRCSLYRGLKVSSA